MVPITLTKEEISLCQGGLTHLILGLNSNRRFFSGNGHHWSAAYNMEKIENAERIIQKLAAAKEKE